MPYRITWRPHGRRHFLALDKPVRQRIDETITKLAEDPRPAGTKSLTGMPGVLRVRAGCLQAVTAVAGSGHLPAGARSRVTGTRKSR